MFRFGLKLSKATKQGALELPAEVLKSTAEHLKGLEHGPAVYIPCIEA